MAADWWAKKLANPQSTQVPRTSLPPVSPPTRIGQHIQFPRTQSVTTSERVLDEHRAPNEEINMSDAIRLWKGGEAHRKEGSMHCPECGSQHVFSRVTRTGNTRIHGMEPAPRCFECGWTGLYTQGDELNWSN